MNLTRLPLVLLILSGVAFASPDLHILSAVVKDQAIDHAELILQRNGQASVRVFSDAKGGATFAGPSRSALDQRTSTLIVKKSGYSNLVVKCPCAGLTYALSPVMEGLDGLRIVLSWGSNPRDLDSHLVYGDEHVFFSFREAPGAILDVDDTDGFGPETITIAHKKAGMRYLYAVHDYSDGDKHGSSQLSNQSNARVFVYIGTSLLRTFTIPKGKVGNTWVVFAVGENGEFTDLNSFEDVYDRPSVGPVLKRLLDGGKLESAPNMSADSRSLADELNLQGEAAYHAKQLDEAVSLYLQAIDNNPEHGQAYSNLGLAYRKLGRDAEALWANEKSIAIAQTPEQANIRASSHYNMGRIYEARRQWREALAQYEAAKRETDLKDYRQSIARMKQKLGER